MSLLPKSIHRCRRYPTKFNSGRDIPQSRGPIHKSPSKGLFMSPLKGAILLPNYEPDQSIFSWSRRWSSCSWSRIYLRTISSSKPTVDTK